MLLQTGISGHWHAVVKRITLAYVAVLLVYADAELQLVCVCYILQP